MPCIVLDKMLGLFLLSYGVKISFFSLFSLIYTNDTCPIISYAVVNNYEGDFTCKCSMY